MMDSKRKRFVEKSLNTDEEVDALVEMTSEATNRESTKEELAWHRASVIEVSELVRKVELYAIKVIDDLPNDGRNGFRLLVLSSRMLALTMTYAVTKHAAAACVASGEVAGDWAQELRSDMEQVIDRGLQEVSTRAAEFEIGKKACADGDELKNLLERLHELLKDELWKRNK